MFRRNRTAVLLSVGLCVVAVAAARPVLVGAQSGATAALSAEEAAALVGDWTIVADGMQGPTTMTLVFAMEDEILSAEIGSPEMATTPITSITKDDEHIVLYYEFDYQGMAVPTTVWLTPDPDAEEESYTTGIDFANGGYYMEGTATRTKS